MLVTRSPRIPNEEYSSRYITTDIFFIRTWDLDDYRLTCKKQGMNWRCVDNIHTKQENKIL